MYCAAHQPARRVRDLPGLSGITWDLPQLLRDFPARFEHL